MKRSRAGVGTKLDIYARGQRWKVLAGWKRRDVGMGLVGTVVPRHVDRLCE